MRFSHLPCGEAVADPRGHLDKRSDAALTAAGWTVLRLRESELLRNVEACRQRILVALGDARDSDQRVRPETDAERGLSPGQGVQVR